jgi:hypothetical protein
VKYTTDHPFADPKKAARELMEITSTVEPVQDGRIPVGGARQTYIIAQHGICDDIVGAMGAITNSRRGLPDGRTYPRVVFCSRCIAHTIVSGKSHQAGNCSHCMKVLKSASTGEDLSCQLEIKL